MGDQIMEHSQDSDLLLPPEGGQWARREPGPFDGLVGPFWIFNGTLETDEPLRLGFRVGRKHLNRGGACHGGMIATYLDMALGLAVHEATKTGGVTMTLSVDYIAAVLEGQWIESRVRFLKGSWRTGNVDGLAIGPNGIVARASGLWRLNRPKTDT